MRRLPEVNKGESIFRVMSMAERVNTEANIRFLQADHDIEYIEGSFESGYSVNFDIKLVCFFAETRNIQAGNYHK